MFESLSHWIKSSKQHNSLFEHSEDETIHVALASLLYKIVMCDDIESRKEKNEFAEILQHEFGMNNEQIHTLHEKVKGMTSTLEDDLSVIHSYLKDKDTVRLNFMKLLNHLISLDGVTDKELDVFYAAQKELFPDIKLP